MRRVLSALFVVLWLYYRFMCEVEAVFSIRPFRRLAGAFVVAYLSWWALVVKVGDARAREPLYNLWESVARPFALLVELPYALSPAFVDAEERGLAAVGILDSSSMSINEDTHTRLMHAIIFSLYDGQFSAPQALLSAAFIVGALVGAAILPGLVLFLYRVIYLEVCGQKGSAR